MTDDWPRRKADIEMSLEGCELWFNPSTGLYERGEGPDVEDTVEFSAEEAAAEIGVNVQDLQRFELEVREQTDRENGG